MLLGTPRPFLAAPLRVSFVFHVTGTGIATIALGYVEGLYRSVCFTRLCRNHHLSFSSSSLSSLFQVLTYSGASVTPGMVTPFSAIPRTRSSISSE